MTSSEPSTRRRWLPESASPGCSASASARHRGNPDHSATRRTGPLWTGSARQPVRGDDRGPAPAPSTGATAASTQGRTTTSRSTGTAAGHPGVRRGPQRLGLLVPRPVDSAVSHGEEARRVTDVVLVTRRASNRTDTRRVAHRSAAERSAATSVPARSIRGKRRAAAAPGSAPPRPASASSRPPWVPTPGTIRSAERAEVRDV